MLFNHLYKKEKNLFEGVHLLKISENDLWRSSTMKLRDVNLQVRKKKFIHISYVMYFVFIFSEYIMITFSEEALKVCKHNFF